jgi:spore maturation protein CgeB
MNYAVPGIEMFFKDHVHQVFWTELGQLIGQCRYYLANEKKRKKIQKNARALILEQHTFDHRVALLDKMLRDERSGISWDMRI